MNYIILPFIGRTVASDSLSTIEKGVATSHTNVWMWIAFTELLIIVILIIVGIRRPKFEGKMDLRKTAEGEVNFGNLINSSFNARELYEELIRKCHPDRFPNDPDKCRIANEIFQEISKNRHNLKRLHELKSEATDKLGISF